MRSVRNGIRQPAIVWRSRADKAVPMLGELIKESSVDTDQKLRYFRAFDFHTSLQIEHDQYFG